MIKSKDTYWRAIKSMLGLSISSNTKTKSNFQLPSICHRLPPAPVILIFLSFKNSFLTGFEDIELIAALLCMSTCSSALQTLTMNTARRFAFVWSQCFKFFFDSPDYFCGVVKACLRSTSVSLPKFFKRKYKTSLYKGRCATIYSRVEILDLFFDVFCISAQSFSSSKFLVSSSSLLAQRNWVWRVYLFSMNRAHQCKPVPGLALFLNFISVLNLDLVSWCSTSSK